MDINIESAEFFAQRDSVDILEFLSELSESINSIIRENGYQIDFIVKCEDYFFPKTIETNRKVLMETLKELLKNIMNITVEGNVNLHLSICIDESVMCFDIQAVSYNICSSENAEYVKDKHRDIKQCIDQVNENIMKLGGTFKLEHINNNEVEASINIIY